jgi:hypothetical protein
MEYRYAVGLTIKQGVRNPFSLLLVSSLFTIALFPIFVSILLGDILVLLAGMWASSIFLGILLIGGFELMVAVAERNISIGVSYFWHGIKKSWKTGVLLGVITFFVLNLSLFLIGNPRSGITGTSIRLIGLYVLVGWSLSIAFTLPIYLKQSIDFKIAFRYGWLLILHEPFAAFWLLIQAIGWTIISILTIITPFLLLPGFLLLLSTNIVGIASESYEADSSPSSGDGSKSANKR